MPTRLTHDDATLDGIRRRVRDRYGADARITGVQRIVPWGIGPLRAKPYFEVEVEIPDDAPAPTVGVEPAARDGIATLLAQADEAQDLLHEQATAGGFDDTIARMKRLVGLDDGAAPDPAPEAAVVSAVSSRTEAPRPAELIASPAAPELPRTPGDMVLFVGIGHDAAAVAQLFSRKNGGDYHGAGSVKARGKPPLTDRRSALLARADGVERSRVVYCGFGFTDPDGLAEDVAALAPDQVWAVVDAGRKPADTAAWVSAIAARTGVHALAVVGTALTSTPSTVRVLGIPIGWEDGD